MSAMLSENGNVSLLELNPDKVDALIRCIEGASLPDKQLLQDELISLRHPKWVKRVTTEVVFWDRMEGVVLEDFRIKLRNEFYIDLKPNMQSIPAINVKAGDEIRIEVIKRS